MKVFTTMLLVLCVALCAQAQEGTQHGPDSPPVIEKERTKGEVDRAVEELRKHGDPVVTGCAVKCKEGKGSIVDGVLNGRAEKLVVPAYPAIARGAQASGVVHVLVLINKEGTVQAAQMIDGNPLFAAASLKAAKESLFTPTLLEGKPQSVVGIIVYNFVRQ